MHFPNKHILIVPPLTPHAKCELCISQDDAIGRIHVQWPHDDQLSNFLDIHVCQDCSQFLAQRLLSLSTAIE